MQKRAPRFPESGNVEELQPADLHNKGRKNLRTDGGKEQGKSKLFLF